MPRPARTSCPRGPGSACCACTPRSPSRSAGGCWPGGTREQNAGREGVVVAPFTRRTGRELLFCLAGVPFAVVNPLVLFIGALDLTRWVGSAGRGNPSPADAAVAGACVGLLTVLL